MLRTLDIVLLVLVVLLAAALGVGFFLYSRAASNYEVNLQQRDDAIALMTAESEGIGAIVSGYKLVVDGMRGKTVHESDLEPISIPSSMADNLIGDLESIVGKFYRVNVSAGTPVYGALLTDAKVADDLRAVDVVTDYIPIGLRVGDYVDIRLTQPLGADYLAIPYKKVYGVYDNVLKILLSGYEMHVYQSMVTDRLLNSGTLIYAAQYVEPGGQQSAISYYPVSAAVAATLALDSNLSSQLPDNLMTRRSVFETGFVLNATDANEMLALDTLLSTGKNSLKETLFSLNSLLLNRRASLAEAAKNMGEEYIERDELILD